MTKDNSSNVYRFKTTLRTKPNQENTLESKEIESETSKISEDSVQQTTNTPEQVLSEDQISKNQAVTPSQVKKPQPQKTKSSLQNQIDPNDLPQSKTNTQVPSEQNINPEQIDEFQFQVKQLRSANEGLLIQKNKLLEELELEKERYQLLVGHNNKLLSEKQTMEKEYNDLNKDLTNEKSDKNKVIHDAKSLKIEIENIKLKASNREKDYRAIYDQFCELSARVELVYAIMSCPVENLGDIHKAIKNAKKAKKQNEI